MNFWGQLGDGTTTDRNAPTTVSSLIDAVDISASYGRTCALKTSGQAVCFGLNSYGQTGDGTSTDHNVPTPVLRGPPIPRRLTVTPSGAGNGNVTSDLAGIDCGTICISDFAEGNEVTLTATPDPGSVFTGWSGACTGSDFTCTLTMNQARRTSARFDRITHQLAVIKNGSGQGSVVSSPSGIDCGTSCEAEFDEGTEVTLTAVPDSDSLFAGWSGACIGSEPACTVTMDQASQITASFKDDDSAVFDGKKLYVRLKCGSHFRPTCNILAVPVTTQGKKGVPMAKASTRKIKSGNWMKTVFTIKPRFREQVERMSTVNRKTLSVRLQVRSKKIGKHPFRKVMRRQKARTVFHRYIVRSSD